VVNDCNDPPQQVVDATSINGLKNALDNHWKEMDVRKHPACLSIIIKVQESILHGTISNLTAFLPNLKDNLAT